MSAGLKLWLFVAIIVIPALLAAVTTTVSFHRASSLEFCGSCHVMTPWYENVTSLDSDSLAAEHYRRRWIQEEQCFTCHSGYSFLGPIQAKINGVRHVVAYYIGDRRRIELYSEFPNENCLKCHENAEGFRNDDNHDPLEDILSGKDRCVECHEDVHGVDQDEFETDAAEPAPADAGDSPEARADGAGSKE